jgi:hypothetical protein
MGYNIDITKKELKDKIANFSNFHFLNTGMFEPVLMIINNANKAIM